MTSLFADRLSSHLTFFYKFIFPVIWIGGFGAVTVAMWARPLFQGSQAADPLEVRLGFLVAAIVGSTFIYWSCIRLKTVSMDDRFLYISDNFTEIQVPLTQVRRVTENRWDNSHPVTIHVSPATAFGEKITFMPSIRLFGLWTSHPVVERIRTAAHLPDEA